MSRVVCILLLTVSLAVNLFFLLSPKQEKSSTPPPARDTLWLPSPVRIDSIPYPVPESVDTAAILQHYFTKRIYRDTILQTEYITVFLRDTVFMNSLNGRVVDYRVTLPEFHNEISLSVTGGYKSLALLAGYRHKRWEWLGGYDVYHKSMVIGAKYSIFKWQ